MVDTAINELRRMSPSMLRSFMRSLSMTVCLQLLVCASRRRIDVASQLLG